MPRAASRRVLAAVLFTDIEDSTAIAEELGDKRWHALVAEHNRLVRRELKRHGGDELDTAGDGFFASFHEPASAIACACAASEQVSSLGIAIRAGVHFGECEPAGKKLTGISVVVGARIMSLGIGGDVLVSGTAAELARGAGFGFEDRGMHHLKGVEDDWRVMAVISVEGEPRAARLDPEEARSRRVSIRTGSVSRRSRRPSVVAAIAAIAAIAGFLVLRHPGAPVPIAGEVGRIAPDGATFDETISLGSRAVPDAIASGDGHLWVASLGNQTLAEVDPASGSLQVVGTPAAPTGVAFGANRVWVTFGFSSDPGQRIGELDPNGGGGLSPASIDVPAGSYPIAVTEAGIWIVDRLGSTVRHYDSVSGATNTIALPDGSGPVAISAGATSLWVAAGRDPEVFRIDAADGKTVSFDTGTDVPTAVAVAPDGTVWIASSSTGSVIALGSDGSTRIHRSIVGRCPGPSAIVATRDAVYVSCSNGDSVARLDPATGGVVRTLAVSGTPGPLGVDGAGRVWVGVLPR